MYQGLQVGRAIAALLVVLSHATLGSDVFYGLAFGGFWYFGHVGVDFFFVLSGFIIYHAHRRDDPGTAAWRRYAAKRLIRIYPPFLPVAAGLLAVYTLLPELSRADRDIGLVPSLFLIPTGRAPALAPSWTLMHEMLFYSFFSLRFLSRRAFVLLSAAWAGAVFWHALHPSGRVLADFLFNAHNLQFLMGVAVSWLVAERGLGNRLLLPVGLLLVAVFAGASHLLDVEGLFGSGTARILYLGVSFSLVVWGLCHLEAAKRMRFPGWLVFLGAASYSIYLIHDPAISVLNRLAAAAQGWILLPTEVVFFLVVCGATLAGVAYYMAWERPVLRWFRRGWLSPRADGLNR